MCSAATRPSSLAVPWDVCPSVGLQRQSNGTLWLGLRMHGATSHVLLTFHCMVLHCTQGQLILYLYEVSCCYTPYSFNLVMLFFCAICSAFLITVHQTHPLNLVYIA
jgi:hypothetical protein